MESLHKQVFSVYQLVIALAIIFASSNADAVNGEFTDPAEVGHGIIIRGTDQNKRSAVKIALRGAMISTNVTESDLRVLGIEWKANLIRWQLNWTKWDDKSCDPTDLRKYDVWLENALKKLDLLLPVCREAGLKVIVDLHTEPGGRGTSHESLMFSKRSYQDKFIETWKKIAARYKDDQTIYGYDLANEPEDRKRALGMLNWQELSQVAAQAIRAIDSAHVIIIEPRWASIDELAKYKPLSLSNIMYSVHMYRPREVAFQGVLEGMPMGVHYPGMINGVMWDKAQLRRVLQPVVDFQNKYNARIYIGEFSAARWAPGDSAYNYLKDVIELFEEYGWDWTYHAFREWHGWSVEYSDGSNSMESSRTPGKRQMLLRSWFEKNAKN